MGEEMAVRGGKGAVRRSVETFENGMHAALHPTQYRLLPSPTAPYRPEVNGGGKRGRTKFIELNVKSLANSPKSTGMEFWSMNPYVGCELGCTYCYAHYTHRYVVERTHHAAELLYGQFAKPARSNREADFTRHIFVKQRSAVLNALERDLARINRASSPADPATLAIGTATDPYQPAERHFGITRSILERLLDVEGLRLGVTTKSPLVCRDIDVLRELGRKHEVTVFLSLICSSKRLIGLFERRSPSPNARLRAICRLREAGVTAGINAAPVLPGVTDSIFEIEALMVAAEHAGAKFVCPSVLRIYPSVRDEFLPVIEQHFPNLVPRYRAAYHKGQSAPADYLKAIERRFEKIARKHGLSTADPFSREEPRQAEPEAQLSLL